MCSSFLQFVTKRREEITAKVSKESRANEEGAVSAFQRNGTTLVVLPSWEPTLHRAGVHWVRVSTLKLQPPRSVQCPKPLLHQADVRQTTVLLVTSSVFHENNVLLPVTWSVFRLVAFSAAWGFTSCGAATCCAGQERSARVSPDSGEDAGRFCRSVGTGRAFRQLVTSATRLVTLTSTFPTHDAIFCPSFPLLEAGQKKI